MGNYLIQILTLVMNHSQCQFKFEDQSDDVIQATWALSEIVTKSHACKTKHVRSLPLIDMLQTYFKHVCFAAIVLLVIGLLNMLTIEPRTMFIFCTHSPIYLEHVSFLCPWLTTSLAIYSLCFKIKVTFGHKMRYEINVTFGEISLKLHQTNWNVVINNVSVVVDELPSEIIVYTCLTIDIWTWQHQHTSMWFYALRCHPPKMMNF